MSAMPPQPHVRAVTGKHRRRGLVTVLMALAFITALIGVFAVWANRQALDTDNWTQTSSELLESHEIQQAVGAVMVDRLFAGRDVEARIRSELPPAAAPLAGPATAGLRELANRAAPRLLAAPRVQSAWREANRAAHAQLKSILEGGSDAVSTQGGVVVLKLGPLIEQLGARLGLQDQAQAVSGKVEGSAQGGDVVIMRSDDLDFAQSVTESIGKLAVLFTALPVALFALAIALATGWRRIALRRTGCCFLALGILVLLGRRVGGNELVDSLVKSPSAEPAAHDAWSIATRLLYDIGVAMLFYGLVFVAAAWLAGPGRVAVGLRGEMAPWLRDRLAVSYGVAAMAFLLVIAWGPTPATRKPLGILLFAGLLILGVEILRRQAAREFPDATPGEGWQGLKARLPARWRRGGAPTAEAESEARFAASREPPVPAGRLHELEQLAALHDRGVLSDAEFDSQKGLILSRS